MSIILNGSTQYLSTTTLYDTYPFSVVGWFKQDDDTGTYALIHCAKYAASTSSHLVQTGGSFAGDPLRALTHLGSWAVAATSTGFSSVTWHHFVAVYNSISDRRIYIDGGSKGTDENIRNLTGCVNFLVGARDSGVPQSHFDGKFAEFGVYDKALSDAEAVSLADGVNTPADVASGNLQYYWPLFDDPNDDQSTNHLTEHNSPSYDTGDHPVTASNFEEASGTISASATLVGTLSGTWALSGTISTVASLTGTVDATIDISGTISGTASLTGILSSGPLVGTKAEKYTQYVLAFGNNTASYEST